MRTPSDPRSAPDPTADLARECVYRFLAAALRDPRDAAWEVLRDPDSRRLACAAADLLAADAAGDGPPFAALCAHVGGPPGACRDEFDRVFGLATLRSCPPHETEYHSSSEPFFRAQQMADVAGFYRAFGVDPARAAPERPDYLPLELEFVALLLLKKRLAFEAGAAERYEVCADAERDFIRDHLAWWLPGFAARLVERAGHGFYADLGRALAWFIAAECRRFGVAAARVPLAVVAAEPREEAAACGV